MPTDKERLTVLLCVIRGGKGYVPATWTNKDGKLTGMNIRTRRDIDFCISAIRADKKARKGRGRD